MTKGFFITFEGGEGAGKSTQITRLADHMREMKLDVLVTREPGGSPGAEAVRHVLLSGAAESLGPAMEAILFASARSDHVEQVIRPAVNRGAIVLCDRFMDSSRVYQGVTSDLDPLFMAGLERVAINGMVPDLTLILDLPADVGMMRAAARRGNETPDRYEKEVLETHERRRAAYQAIAKAEPQRCVLVDAARPIDEISADIAGIVSGKLAAAGVISNKQRAVV